MSLDIHLTEKGRAQKESSGIFVRVNGQIREVSREEWNEMYPNREPIIATIPDHNNEEVYWANITHNLSKMAAEAGLYKYLWRPQENGISHAHQLVEPLRKGLAKLKSDPEKYGQFNSPNGWGVYENLVEFVSNYLKACESYPHAEVSVSC